MRAYFAFDRNQRVGFALSQHRCDAVQGVIDGGPNDWRTIIATQLEVNTRQGQRQTARPIRDVSPLGALALQEFPARRDLGEEVGDLDSGALRSPRASLVNRFPGIDENLDAFVAPACAGEEPQSRNGGHRGKRLPPEAETPYGFEIGILGELAGRVPGQREPGFPGGHPAAIVAHGDQCASSVPYVDSDTCRLGV